jgi:hypothetical protein
MIRTVDIRTFISRTRRPQLPDLLLLSQIWDIAGSAHQRRCYDHPTCRNVSALATALSRMHRPVPSTVIRRYRQHERHWFNTSHHGTSVFSFAVVENIEYLAYVSDITRILTIITSSTPPNGSKRLHWSYGSIFTRFNTASWSSATPQLVLRTIHISVSLIYSHEGIPISSEDFQDTIGYGTQHSSTSRTWTSPLKSSQTCLTIWLILQRRFLGCYIPDYSSIQKTWQLLS